jgi:hypothetical protein
MSWPGAPTTNTQAGPAAAAAAPYHGIPRQMAAQPPSSWQPTPSAPYSTTATISSSSTESWQDPLMRAQQTHQQQQLQVTPSAPPGTAATAAAGLPGQQPLGWPAAGAGAKAGVGAGGMIGGGFGCQAHGATVPPYGAGGSGGAGLPARGDGYATTGVGGVGRGTMQQQIKVLEGAGGVLVIESGWAE